MGGEEGNGNGQGESPLPESSVGAVADAAAVFNRIAELIELEAEDALEGIRAIHREALPVINSATEEAKSRVEKTAALAVLLLSNIWKAAVDAINGAKEAAITAIEGMKPAGKPATASADGSEVTRSYKDSCQ